MFDIIASLVTSDTGDLTGGAAIAVTVLIGILNVVSRSIPDSATGWLGMVRRVSGFFGAHKKDDKS